MGKFAKLEFFCRIVKKKLPASHVGIVPAGRAVELGSCHTTLRQSILTILNCRPWVRPGVLSPQRFLEQIAVGRQVGFPVECSGWFLTYLAARRNKAGKE